MSVHEFTGDEIRRLDHTTLNSTQLQERRDLQRLRRANVDVIAAKTVVIFEEFDHWDDFCRRIDLLSIDQKAKSVVTELKRTEDVTVSSLNSTFRPRFYHNYHASHLQVLRNRQTTLDLLSDVPDVSKIELGHLSAPNLI